MKKNLMLMAALATLIMPACKKNGKDNPSQEQITVNGFYFGKMNQDPSSSEFSSNYGILFRQNGTARVYNNMGNSSDTSTMFAINKVEGTWQQNGSILLVNYKPTVNIITFNGTVNKSATELSGTWGFEGATKGKISIKKQ
jgi:hypothetical protein